MSKRISNKVCIVTGGGNGIGRSICEEIAAAGARGVFVVDIKIQSAKEVAESISSLATHPNFQSGYDQCDVGKEDDIKQTIMSAWKTFGVVDAYFSNAGIFTIGGIDENEVSNEAWDNIWRINAMSHIWAARCLFPLWKQNNHRNGIFVITASAAGLLMQPGCLPYHVTKHAAVSIADWLAVSHHKDGVSVHCLCPQAVQTAMLSSSVDDLSGKETKIASLAGRDGILKPKDVAIETLQAIDEGTFMILPHKQVKKYFIGKATDYGRWIRRMVATEKHFSELLQSPSSRSRL